MHALQTSETDSETENLFASIGYNTIKKGKALYASADFAVGDVITLFYAKEVLDLPNYLTLQLDEQRHILLLPDCLQFTNHSCTPNIFFDTTTMNVVAIKSIAVGDELTFFYPSTEWNMAQAFECRCGTENCLHTIRGAKYMPRKILKKYTLTGFIQKMLGYK